MKSNKTTALLMLLVFLLVVSVVIIFLTGLDRPASTSNPYQNVTATAVPTVAVETPEPTPTPEATPTPTPVPTNAPVYYPPSTSMPSETAQPVRTSTPPPAGVSVPSGTGAATTSTSTGTAAAIVNFALIFIITTLQLYLLCIPSCCCYPVAQPCLSLCDPMDCSTPGFPVLHHLLELSQTFNWIFQAFC